MTKHHHPKPLMDTPLGPTGGQRLYSLDALRGFDMFWILGAEDIFNELAKGYRPPCFPMDFQSAYPSGLEWISFV